MIDVKKIRIGSDVGSEEAKPLLDSALPVLLHWLFVQRSLDNWMENKE